MFFFFDSSKPGAEPDDVLPDLPQRQADTSKKKMAKKPKRSVPQGRSVSPTPLSEPGAAPGRLKKPRNSYAAQQQARDQRGRWTRDTSMGRVFSLFTPSGRQRASRAVKSSARRMAAMSAQRGGIPLERRKVRRRRGRSVRRENTGITGTAGHVENYRQGVVVDLLQRLGEGIGVWFS
jgi:hypothetical protein